MATDGFPFSGEDWLRVQDAAREVLNATLAGDDVLRASHFEGLRIVVTELRSRYGDHPALLETQADFSDDPVERRRLYQHAIREAQDAELVTYSARTALARLLLDDFDEPDLAYEELKSCELEVSSHADESEQAEWAELLGRCSTRPQGTEAEAADE